MTTRLITVTHTVVVAQWEALPLLLSCKFLHQIALEELYRDIIILDTASLRNLMRDPHPDSYHFIQTLDIAHVQDEFFPDLEDDVENRVFQSKGSAFARYRQEVGWNSTLSAARELKERWISDCKPRLRMLKGAGVNDNVVACLLKLWVQIFRSSYPN